MTAPDTTREAAKAKTFARKVLAGVTSQVKKSYEALKARYGPRYTKAMVGAAFVAIFSPLPGSVPIVIAVLMVVAEVHRAIAKRGGLLKVIARERVMSINCDFILQRSATPAVLAVMGSALWRLCNRPAGRAGVYQHLDNQALADLIAGKLPASGPTKRAGFHFRFRDDVSHDRQTTVSSLRGNIPAKSVEDILVEGKSWNLSD